MVIDKRLSEFLQVEQLHENALKEYEIMYHVRDAKVNNVRNQKSRPKNCSDGCGRLPVV